MGREERKERIGRIGRRGEENDRGPEALQVPSGNSMGGFGVCYLNSYLFRICKRLLVYTQFPVTVAVVNVVVSITKNNLSIF